MKQYFDSQMRILQEEAVIFAKKYPEHARYLNIDSVDARDPNVERLLEGFAYLTGKIQQQLDNGLLDVSEVLLSTLSPQSLKAMPSKAIVQYCFSKALSSTDLRKITSEHHLLSNGVGDEKTSCKFVIEKNINIFPLTIDNISQQVLANGSYELHLDLLVNDNANSFSIPSIEFYLNSDSLTRFAWLYALLENCQESFILHQQQTHKISIRHPLLNNDVKLDNFFGLELLKGFFCFRDKFMFFELLGFSELVFNSSEKIKFIFILKEPIAATHINCKDNLLLGCCSAKNEFNYSAEPITVEEQKHSQPMLIDSSRRQSVLLQKIKSVSSEQANIKQFEYLPFSAYQSNSKNVVYFRLQRDHRLLEINSLILSGGENAINKQVLSIEVEASNGYYPRKFISSRELFLDSKFKTLEINATNITRPSEYIALSNKQEYYWRLLGMLSENYYSLSKREKLIKNLHLYDVHEHYKTKINAIVQTKIETKQQFSKGVLYQGIKYKLLIDEAKFESQQELYFFGLLLHYFLLPHVEVNHFLITELKFVHQEKVFVWQCQQGNRQ